MNTTTINNLDLVWAKMPAADRIVLVGHDNNYLTDEDRTRVMALLTKNGQARTTAANPRPHTRPNINRRPTR